MEPKANLPRQYRGKFIQFMKHIEDQ